MSLGNINDLIKQASENVYTHVISNKKVYASLRSTIQTRENEYQALEWMPASNINDAAAASA